MSLLLLEWEIKLIQVSVLPLLTYYYIRKRFSLNDDACQLWFSKFHELCDERLCMLS